MKTTKRPARQDFIPAGAAEHADEQSDATVYLYDGRGGRPCAVAFVGRAARPKWHWSFRTREAREGEIERLFADRRRLAHSRAERARPHSLNVGEILYSARGYEQTNVLFLQITRVLPASVEARQIEALHVEAAPLAMAGTCTPVRDAFIGPPRRYRAYGTNAVVLGRGVRATVWDGQPKYWSSYW